jgi:hypothetical protein
MPNPLLPSARLRKRYDIYLNEEEREQLALKAAVAKLPVSTFVRLAALGLPIKAPPGEASLARWQNLARTTANLNQLTHAINSGQATGIEPEVINELAEQVRLLRLELLGSREARS